MTANNNRNGSTTTAYSLQTKIISLKLQLFFEAILLLPIYQPKPLFITRLTSTLYAQSILQPKEINTLILIQKAPRYKLLRAFNPLSSSSTCDLQLS